MVPPEIAPVVIVPSQVPIWTAAITAVGLLVTAIGTVVTAVLGFLGLMRVRDVHVEINHRMDQLLIARQAEGHAAGMEEQRAKSDPEVLK